MLKKWVLVFLSFLGAGKIDVCATGWMASPVLVSSIQGGTYPRSFGYSDNGTAFISLIDEHSTLWALRFNNTWEPPKLISTYTEGKVSFLGVDFLGNSLLVYSKLDGLYASRYDASSREWFDPVHLFDGFTVCQDLVMNGLGEGLTLFKPESGGLYASRYKADSKTWVDTLSESVKLDDTDESILSARLAIDASGNGLAVFHSGSSNTIKASRYDSSTGEWLNTGASAIELSLDDVVSNFENAFVAMSSSGTGCAIWGTHNLNIRSSWFNGTSWENTKDNAFTIALEGYFSRSIYPIAMDDEGNVFAIWAGPGETVVEVSRFDAVSHTWDIPSVIYHGEGYLSNLQISTDQMGNAFAAWMESRGEDETLSMTAFYNRSLGEWENVSEEAVVLSEPEENSAGLILKANRQGKAIAVFQQGIDLPGTFSNFFPVDIPENGSGFVGKGYQDKFLSQIDYVHSLRWESSRDSSVVGYIIRSNGRIISEVDANRPLRLDVHSQKSGVFVSYSLTSVNSSRVESSPLLITLE